LIILSRGWKKDVAFTVRSTTLGLLADPYADVAIIKSLFCNRIMVDSIVRISKAETLKVRKIFILTLKNDSPQFKIA